MYTLPSGDGLIVRPITADDQWRFRKAWASMSPRNRYLRFHGGHLSEHDACIQYLTDVDQQRHVAYGAVLVDQPHHPGVGVVRFVVQANDPTSAELAVTVVDGFQQQGVGRFLLDCAVQEALKRGIKRFTFRILPGRHRLHAGLQRYGAQMQGLEDGAILYHLDLTAYRDRAPMPPLRRPQTEWPAPVAPAG